MMRTLWTAVLFLSVIPLALAQEDPDPGTPPPPVPVGDEEDVLDVQIDEATGIVSIASKGLDVRDVLFDLFDQAQENFVLAPNVRHALYLSLAGVEFEEALYIMCETASLTYEQQNGIFYIQKKTDETPPIQPPKPQPRPEPVRQPLGKLTDDDLQKRLTTRLAKTDIREVFQEFSNQTGIVIEIEEEVPDYAIDAFLIDTSLKFALDVVTRAAGLEYERTDNKSIRISKKS